MNEKSPLESFVRSDDDVLKKLDGMLLFKLVKSDINHFAAAEPASDGMES
jgi:hypothetical protein